MVYRRKGKFDNGLGPGTSGGGTGGDSGQDVLASAKAVMSEQDQASLDAYLASMTVMKHVRDKLPAAERNGF